jgi:pimeloyl-ACP methyl ester carboxylesterase
MKTALASIVSLWTILFIFTGCSSTGDIETVPSLYKTEEGKSIAFKSYNEALSLFTEEFSEEYVPTEYGETHVLLSGDPEGQPVILIPGLFGDASMWYANMGELSKQFKVFAFDMPNYGGKSKPSGKEIKDILDYKSWFTQIMDHYQLNDVSILGVSYSSWLALALTREMPEKISSLVLLDPSETFMPMNGGIAWKGFTSFMFFPNRNKYSKFLDWLGGGYIDQRMAIWREHMMDVMEYGSTKMFDIPQHRIYEPEELTMVNMPVLVLAGGKPILYKDPNEFKASALQSLPHAKVEIVEGCGHGLNMENPTEVNHRIITFLNENLISSNL